MDKAIGGSSQTQSQSRTEGIFSRYHLNETFFDEVYHSENKPREGWEQLLETADAIGNTELERRYRQSLFEIYETGIAYNAFDEDAESVRPWQLDLLPQFFGREEWQSISKGLVQRANLLNRVLVDLYGAQSSITEGLIPADWLFAHPGFHRVFHGANNVDSDRVGRQESFFPTHGFSASPSIDNDSSGASQPQSNSSSGSNQDTILHFYSADLARSPDGKWWVVEDRTDAPMGLGYSLENRIATSRMLPNAIRRMNIERLAPFFRKTKEMLAGLSKSNRDNPRIVLLSHGPDGPNYFEDAYLSRYLGYTLVEGGDLTVRNDKVYLKTLGGLLRVDVIFRRMSDGFCDPLALRGSHGLGVPGLLQAVRQGNVAVANALGSSLIESPSIFPFLPGIARSWLDEELMLPSVATWWCGQESQFDSVLRKMEQSSHDRFKVVSAYRAGRKKMLSSSLLAKKKPDELLEMIRANPREFVVREKISRSTSPVWSDKEQQSWHVGMRVYVVGIAGDYQVMPGGLIRLGQDQAKISQSFLGGKYCKDIWVPSAGPVHHESLLAPVRQPVIVRRSGAELPSRVVDNLFWFGRQTERAMGGCRLLRAIVELLTGEEEFDESEQLERLVHCLAEQGQIEPGFVVDALKPLLPTLSNALPKNVLDESQSGSIRSTIGSAYRNASLVRDRLSLDSWKVIRHLELLLERAAQQSPFGLAELDELLDELVVNLSSLNGLIGENMTRSLAWRFLELGKRIERAVHVASLIQLIQVELKSEESVIEAILDVGDSKMTYRGRYLSVIHRVAAIELMLTDETNPRSLAYQLLSIKEHVANLPSNDSAPFGSPEEQIADSLLHYVKLLRLEDLESSNDPNGNVAKLMERVSSELPKLSELISHRYLIHAGVPRQMGAQNQNSNHKNTDSYGQMHQQDFQSVERKSDVSAGFTDGSSMDS